MSRCTGVWSEVMSGCTGVWSEVMSGCTGVWSEVMSPGGREVAPSGREREDAGPGLLTLPPLKERLPDVPEPPTRGTAGRGLVGGGMGGIGPCSGRDPPRKRQPGVPGRGTQSRRPGRGRGDRPGRI